MGPLIDLVAKLVFFALISNMIVKKLEKITGKDKKNEQVPDQPR